jgi:hypothetical protein
MTSSLCTSTENNPSKIIQIFAKVFGNIITINTTSNITIRQLKILISNKFFNGTSNEMKKNNIEWMRIIFSGVQLIDDRFLSSYGIKDGSTIQVLGTLRGD